MVGNPSPLLPDGIDPFDSIAAHNWAIKCLDAIVQLSSTVAATCAGAKIQNRAALRCLYSIDLAYDSSSNYHIFSKDRCGDARYARARTTTGLVRAAVRRSVESFSKSPDAPSDGWTLLWDEYSAAFDSTLGPTWADAVSRIVSIDDDEEGLLHEAVIGIPNNLAQPRWHPLAWPAVCEAILTEEQRQLCEEARDLVDQFVELPAKEDAKNAIVRDQGLAVIEADNVNGKEHPRWDGKRGILFWRGRIDGEVDPTRAKNVVPFLDALEAAGWPDPIDSPFDVGSERDKHDALLDQLRHRTTNGQKVPRFKHIRFDGAGSGTQIRWSVRQLTDDHTELSDDLP